VTGMLQRDRAALVVVDVQEAFRGAVGEFDAVARAAGTLVQGARLLGLPVVVTQQYPRGLGETVPEVAQHLDGIRPLDKEVFSACRADGFDLGERDQAVVCGVEAHVCVSQTVHDLVERGVEVHVATDAVSSRTAANRRVGLAKMARAGAVLS
jgi:nicotinamidase-related amidase